MRSPRYVQTIGTCFCRPPSKTSGPTTTGFLQRNHRLKIYDFRGNSIGALGNKLGLRSDSRRGRSRIPMASFFLVFFPLPLPFAQKPPGGAA